MRKSSRRPCFRRTARPSQAPVGIVPVKVWNAADGTLLRTLAGHSSAVLSISFSPDGKRIAGGSSDHTVIIWDMQTGKLLTTLKDAENPVAFSPDGATLATGTEVHALKIWDVRQWKELHTLEGHTDLLTALAFSPDSKVVGTGSADTDALLWNALLWQEATRLRLQLGWVRSVTFTPDSKTFLAGAGRVVQFYDVQNGSNLKTLQTPFEIVNGIALSPDGKTLAVAGTFKSGTETAGMENKAALYSLSEF